MMYSMTCRNRAFLSSLILMAILFGMGLFMPVWAQSGSTASSITGKVTDETGAIIPGASVTARNIKTNLTREVFSGEDGSFLITQLPPGTYELISTADGFNTKTAKIDLDLGTTIIFDFAMKIGAT